jgi:hypothetical protein
MTAITKAALKAFFNTGDKPTEAQFADFIDSYPNLSDGDYGLMNKYDVLYSALSGSVYTQDILLCSNLPAWRCHDFNFVFKAAFTGPSLSNFTVAFIDMTYNHVLHTAVVPFGSIIMNMHFSVSPIVQYQGSYNTSWNFGLRFTSTNCYLKDLTAGEILCFYRRSLLP